MNRRRSAGGVTVGNAWMYNDPDLAGHKLGGADKDAEYYHNKEEEENRKYMEHYHEFMKYLYLKDKGY